MNSDEYTSLDAIEQVHWFYRGKRDMVLHWLKKLSCLDHDHVLVDCGAGTGYFVSQVSQACKAYAVDDHDESIEIAIKRLSDEQVIRGSCCELPFENDFADVITSLDVLEHIEDDRRALSEKVRILKPGGYLILTVPAFMSLWSEWDEKLHHYRRYRKSGLSKLMAVHELELAHIAYTNVAAFIPIFLIRRIPFQHSASLPCR